MAAKLSPIGNAQTELADGTPAVGQKYFFYVAGSVNTKRDSFTDSTGGVANTNPVVLNSLGFPPNGIWLGDGLLYKIVLAPSTDTDPPTSPIKTWDNVSGVNDVIQTAIVEWTASGMTPTFVSTTSFTLAGDQTSAFHVGRRLKTTNSGGTIYSTITASVFGAVTTVTVVNDSGVLDSGLSAVSYGILSAVNPSNPLLIDTYPVVSGSADKTKKLRFEVDGFTTATTRVVTPPDYDHRIMSQTKGADIASAATVNLDTATGDLVDVTGTTTITAITLAEGKMATVRFTGVLTLTNGASLVLPGGLNITTAAGDVAILRGYAAGVVRCVNYQAISPGPIPGFTKLNSGSASGATLDIVMTSYTAYKHKKLVVTLIPVTDGVSLDMRFSTNGGGAYDAGATDYGIEVISGGATTSANTTGITLSSGGLIGNAATEGFSADINLYDTTDAALWTRASFHGVQIDNTATPVVRFPHGGAARRAAQDTDAVRFLFSAGNIASGAWTLYGWN